MLPTHNVINVIGVTLVTLLCGYHISSGQREPLLDLTKPALQHRSMGLPGGTFGGLAGGPSLGPTSFKLPLTQSLESVSIDEPGAKLIVELRITNRGTTVFQLPACTDEFKADPKGSGNRRRFIFGVQYTAKSAAGRVSHQDDGIGTVASDSTANCNLAIQPGHSVFVRFRARLPNGIASDLVSLNSISSYSSETRICDDSFSTCAISETVHSNTIETILAPH